MQNNVTGGTGGRVSALFAFAVISTLAWGSIPASASETNGQEGPIRILFLGHDREHHNSDEYYPMLAKALGRDGIYFDYVTEVDKALDRDYLNQFDGLLLYANHKKITDKQLTTLIDYVESGHGFIPVHSASACFPQRDRFIDLVGARFKSHGTGVFQSKIRRPGHPAMENVSEFKSWDETYVHAEHNKKNRTVLMVRERQSGGSELWTWARAQGKGRVFYTASGHDQRTWSKPEFHQLLKSGILWAVGEQARSRYERFLAERAPLRYDKRPEIPNYEQRPEALPYQLPLPPEESMAYTRVPIEFELELFASEPQITDPICLAWDRQGRLWVAESIDYPNEVDDHGGDDRIKILEDTDNDGRCDKVTVFAKGLNLPTSLTFSNGGVVVAQAPKFLFLKDTDGDDHADVRQVIMKGWGTGDTHAGPSSLRYGLDNWLYGTVGYASFDGKVGGERHRFGQGVYRFRPDGSHLEFLHQFNNNTWGVAFNRAGDVFGSTANDNPSFFGGIPATIYPEGKGGTSARMIADSTEFHPITPRIRQVDAFGSYTAGCGHAFATSEAFPPSYRNRIAFVNGPTGHLTGQFRIERDGAGFIAKNRFSFIASADEWFSPVAAEVGPDGALWIADWYDFIIQHNPTPSPERGGYQAERGQGNAHINPNRDDNHGRIYRVVWDQAPEPEITSLAGATVKELVAALESGNQFWRLTAQRLLVQNDHREAVPALKKKLSGSGSAAIHALWALHGLNALDKESHQKALLSDDPDLRQNAIKALGSDDRAIQLFFDTAVVADPNLRVRLAAFNRLSRFPTSESVRQAVRQLFKNPQNRGDQWLQQSLKVAAMNHDVTFERRLAGENRLPNPSFEQVEDSLPKAWQVRTYGGAASHRIDESIAHSGSRSLRIESDEGADTSLFTDVALDPEAEYQLSGWIRTKGVRGAKGALMNVHGRPPEEGATPAVDGDSEWEKVTLRFNSGNASTVSINCLFGGWGESTGTAWFDDVSLAKLVYEERAERLSGDPERGRRIFHEHPVAACIRCHQVNGEGGVVGPALDGIASRKTRDYLRESLVDPNATIAEDFEQKASPMPPMGVLLSDQELKDVMAYLMTLTGSER